MSIRAKHAHFTNWAKVCEAINNVMVNNVKVNNVSTDEEARTFLTTTNDGNINPFYYMVCYIKSTKEIYTHGVFYSSLQDLYDDISDITESIKNLSTDLTTLSNEVSENELVWAKALSDLHENKADKTEIPTNISDLTNDLNLITEDELNIGLTTKQDLLISGTNIKTFQGKSLLGSGEVAPGTTYVANFTQGTYTLSSTWTTNHVLNISNTSGTINFKFIMAPNDTEKEWHLTLILQNQPTYQITFLQTISWVNDAIPVLDRGIYEFHFKYIQPLNLCLGVCATYPLP